MNTEFIQLKDVTKRFGRNFVLENANLSIPDNQITGIVGASGEGKTTILKLIIGFYKPTKGQVLFLKRNVFRDWKNIKRIFGFATEDGSFYEELSVKENVYFFGRLYKMKSSEINSRAKEILELVDLTSASRTRAKNLSVGMKKRLDIACSMIHKPEVLILDEPTADLDPLLRSQMLSLIKKIKGQGTTIIMTTQILSEMDDVCDKVAILNNKKIIEEGTPKQIKSKYNARSLDEVFNKIFAKDAKVKEYKAKVVKKAPEKPKPATEKKESYVKKLERTEETKEKSEERVLTDVEGVPHEIQEKLAEEKNEKSV